MIQGDRRALIGWAAVLIACSSGQKTTAGRGAVEIAPPVEVTPPPKAPPQGASNSGAERPVPPKEMPAGPREAYRATVDAYNRFDPAAYFDGFVDPLECFYGEKRLPVERLRHRRRDHFESHGGRLTVDVLRVIEQTDRTAILVDRGSWRDHLDRTGRHEKVIAMALRQGRWRITAETNRKHARCLGDTLDRGSLPPRDGDDREPRRPPPDRPFEGSWRLFLDDGEIWDLRFHTDGKTTAADATRLRPAPASAPSAPVRLSNHSNATLTLATGDGRRYHLWLNDRQGFAAGLWHRESPSGPAAGEVVGVRDRRELSPPPLPKLARSRHLAALVWDDAIGTPIVSMSAASNHMADDERNVLEQIGPMAVVVHGTSTNTLDYWDRETLAGADLKFLFCQLGNCFFELEAEFARCDAVYDGPKLVTVDNPVKQSCRVGDVPRCGRGRRAFDAFVAGYDAFLETCRIAPPASRLFTEVYPPTSE